MTDRLKHVGLHQPYQLIGYTGLCPDVQYRIGKGFGIATHLAMCDPKVFHSEKLALSREIVEDSNEDYGAKKKIAAENIRKQLIQEVMLLKGTRRPQNLKDRMSLDCPRVPLTPVTVVCKGYNHPARYSYNSLASTSH
uniref:Uncharacterized protein n=1 Tax=Cuerna arida TaxID=1464854 RepID=A0A1B6FLB9_9HEMI